MRDTAGKISNDDRYVFLEENVRVILGEGVFLLDEHYAEIAHYKDIALDPDVEKYVRLDEMGILRVFTIRVIGSQDLIGYCVFSISTSLHYRRTLVAAQDVLFITKEHRGLGREFISWCDTELKKSGVIAVYHNVKAAHDWSHVLTDMGYALVDKVYSKRLNYG